MIKDRESQVVELLKNNNWHMFVNDISEKLSISNSTTRRIIQRLVLKGVAKHNYGSVDLLIYNTNLTPFKYRAHKNIAQKKIIARLASAMVKENDVVYLDGSSTSFYIAEYLKSYSDIKIITNNLEILNSMIETNITVYSTGGQISNINRSVLVGDFAYSFVKDITVDISFISTQAIDKNGDVFDACENENFIKRTMISNSRKKYMVCVSDKFDTKSTFKLCNIEEFDGLITEDSTKFKFNNNYSKVIDGYSEIK